MCVCVCILLDVVWCYVSSYSYSSHRMGWCISGLSLFVIHFSCANFPCENSSSSNHLLKELEGIFAVEKCSFTPLKWETFWGQQQKENKPNIQVWIRSEHAYSCFTKPAKMEQDGRKKKKYAKVIVQVNRHHHTPHVILSQCVKVEKNIYSSALSIYFFSSVCFRSAQYRASFLFYCVRHQTTVLLVWSETLIPANAIRFLFQLKFHSIRSSMDEKK